MVAVLGFSKEEIRHAVQDVYTAVANQPDTPLHFPVGRDACRLAGYTSEDIDSLPDASLKSFAGVGCPFRADVIRPGQTVLDVGSGSGTDVLIAARMVRGSGKVWALDVTAAMRSKLQKILDDEGIGNVEVLEGDAEHIPLPDASVDVVTSNGVLNLVPDKRRAIGEIFRVLKPGGSVQVADIVIASPVTPDCEGDPKLWAECVVGATVDESYLLMFQDAGFRDIEVIRDYDYFAHSPSEETREVARQFGAHAFELRMRRGDRAPAPALQWLKRLDPRRAAGAIQRRGLWGTVSLLAAVLSCYGTLAVLALLSILGVSLSLNESIWAAAIIGFALLATAVMAVGWRTHRSIKPAICAIIGTGILAYAMYVNYHILIEFLGFAVLVLAAWLDYDYRRWAKVSDERRAHRSRRKHDPAPSAS